VGLLNFLGIFIILGIGADDLFVILEFWRGLMKPLATSYVVIQLKKRGSTIRRMT
jgi:hypothetical protein